MTSTTPEAVSAAPEVRRSSVGAWLKKNLFKDWFNSILTILVAAVLIYGLYSLVNWALTTAQWAVIPNNIGLYMTGTYPAELYWRIWTLLGIISALAGASWGILGRNLQTLFAARVIAGLGVIAAFIVLFPPTRIGAEKLLPMVVLVVGTAWIGRQVSLKFSNVGRGLILLWYLSSFVAAWLINGGIDSSDIGVLVLLPIINLVLLLAFLALERVNLPSSLRITLALARWGALYLLPLSWAYWLIEDVSVVSTNDWGGMVLTLFTAITGIYLCFPLGIILALGRRSALPIVKLLSTAYIELVRGVPLVAFLFMGQVMIPLFLPDGLRPDRVLRAIIALALFSAAYLAENVRAGLQAVPRGQQEAARSMGLNTPMTLGLIVLPQALKIAIPAIVGQFISLFQDTTLLAIVGLAELLGISRSVLANPNYLGRYAEVYLFIGVIYWFFCYSMSLASRKIEEQLNTER